MLREYQSRAVEKITGLVKQQGASPVLVAPTGSGKTVMGAEVVKTISVPTLWLAHRKELITQAARALKKIGMHVGIIKSGIKPNPEAQIQVASVGTLVRRDRVENVGLIVVDECHHVEAASYKKIIEKYNCPVIGLTATPFRLDGKGLNETFNEIVVAAYPDELIPQGYLVKPKVIIGKTPSMKGVSKTGGDYSRTEAGERVGKLTGDIIKSWKKYVNGGKTIIYAMSIEHSKKIANDFNAAGIPVVQIDGTTPPRERHIALLRLKTGYYNVLVNVDILTEGFDLPSLDAVIIARPTESLNLHLQIDGRVMRPAEGKRAAVIIDHAGNHYRHGDATRRIDYTLEGVRKSPPLNMRTCEECFVLFDIKDIICPECGCVVDVKHRNRAASYISKDGTMVEFEPFSFETQAEVYNQLREKMFALGRSNKWLRYKFKEIFGFMPVTAEWGKRLINPAQATKEEKEKVFTELSETAKKLKYKQGWVSHQYRILFGVWPKGFVKKVRKAL